MVESTRPALISLFSFLTIPVGCPLKLRHQATRSPHSQLRSRLLSAGPAITQSVSRWSPPARAASRYECVLSTRPRQGSQSVLVLRSGPPAPELPYQPSMSWYIRSIVLAARVRDVTDTLGTAFPISTLISVAFAFRGSALITSRLTRLTISNSPLMNSGDIAFTPL